jgi:long-chain acyl-CoA synthetase
VLVKNPYSLLLHRLVEYIAPEKIENVLIQSLLVAQSFVYGDSFQSTLVAIIIPDEEPVRHMLASSEDTQLAEASFTQICKSEKLKNMIIEDIKRLAKHNGLHGLETPKALHFSDELFSVENGLLTPTFKLKRQQARDRYEKEIEVMYAAMPPPKSKI